MTDSSEPTAARRTWKITLAYDGTDFSGWQVQPGELTIQGELQAALGRITGEAPLPQGSGRTDAGVHALGQVASFPLQAPIPPENLLRALNRTLPPPSAFSKPRRFRIHFMPATRRSQKPMNTGCFARRSVLPFWLATPLPAPGQWTWRPCKRQRNSLRENTIS